MTPMERKARMRQSQPERPSAPVGEPYYIRTNHRQLAIRAAQRDHARRHGYVGTVLHVEMVREDPPLFEVVLATNERVEDGS